MIAAQKTYSFRPGDRAKKWVAIDAEGVVLGRLASQVALRLRGKHYPHFTPHQDCGDNVVIVNAEKVKLTGRKRADKRFYWHTGSAGGIKCKTAGEILDGRYPERVITKAVERMLTRGPLGRQQMRNLRVYAGPVHPHEAQQPELIDIGGQNDKNTRQNGIGKAVKLAYSESFSSNANPRSQVPMDRLNRDKLQLESMDEALRVAALDDLSRVFVQMGDSPTPDNFSDWRLLRSWPDFLLDVLINNASAPMAGPAAAHTLLSCLYPTKYKNAVPEEDMLQDLERALHKRGLEFFSRVSANALPGGKVEVKASVFDHLPFKLANRYPKLSEAEWAQNGVEICASGAKVSDGHPMDAKEPGMVAACIANLEPSEEEGKSVVVYLRSQMGVFDRHVFDRKQLFGGLTLGQ